MTDSYIISAHWLNRDDKTYFYGPYEGQEELAAGMALLSLLWRDKIAAGDVGLYQFPLGKPPWLNAPTTEVRTGYPEQPWLSGKPGDTNPRWVRGFPMD